jgi:hypothetical protein
MDVNGAKALKERLKGANEAPPAVMEAPEDAPPVYHWFGAGKAAADAPSRVVAEAAPERRSRFRRPGRTSS